MGMDDPRAGDTRMRTFKLFYGRCGICGGYYLSRVRHLVNFHGWRYPK